jgi:hypothetical protein
MVESLRQQLRVPPQQRHHEVGLVADEEERLARGPQRQGHPRVHPRQSGDGRTLHIAVRLV